MIKIEKIKRKYDKYELSFTTIANGLPEQVPFPQHESHQYYRGQSLYSVDEEEAGAASPMPSLVKDSQMFSNSETFISNNKV